MAAYGRYKTRAWPMSESGDIALVAGFVDELLELGLHHTSNPPHHGLRNVPVNLGALQNFDVQPESHPQAMTAPLKVNKERSPLQSERHD